MITRRTWVQAHARRLPQADAYEAVHAELFEARRFDRAMYEFEEQLAQEIERELQREAR